MHDAECGDGIDVRLSGTARFRAKIARNTVQRPAAGRGPRVRAGDRPADRRQGAARRAARPQRARPNLGNEEDAGAGPEGADSEGVFVNPTGPSTLNAEVARNTYTNPNGLGGFSANGLEFVSMGDGARGDVRVRNSEFSGTPGDVLEQLALGTNAQLSLELVDVVAERSTGFAGPGFGNTVLDSRQQRATACCPPAAAPATAIELAVRGVAPDRLREQRGHLRLGGRQRRGPDGPAQPRDRRTRTITGNRGANLRVGNETGLDELSVKVERSNLSDSQGTGIGRRERDVRGAGHDRAQRRSTWAAGRSGAPAGTAWRAATWPRTSWATT